MLATYIVLPLMAALFIAAPASRGNQVDLPEVLAMGPDPGGKSGEGVTPETTTTDHPAASGPQSQEPSAKRDHENGKDGSANREGETDRRENQPQQNQGPSDN